MSWLRFYGCAGAIARCRRCTAASARVNHRRPKSARCGTWHGSFCLPFTAARAQAASPCRGEGRSYVDLERGIFYRLAEGARATNKRQPPVPLPRRLLAHLRRWVAKGIVTEHFVEWHGRPLKSVKTAFKTALRLAQVSGRISPHTLRHTAATWLMQNGVDKCEAAGFLGMSVEMLDRVYGHHHPEHLRGAAHALGYRRPQSLAITLAPGRRPRPLDRQGVGNTGGPGSTHIQPINDSFSMR